MTEMHRNNLTADAITRQLTIFYGRYIIGLVERTSIKTEGVTRRAEIFRTILRP